MTCADAALGLFTVFNAVRVIAYTPQIMKIIHDDQGARAVSMTTWTMFFLSHGSTVAYGLFVVNDTTMALIFGVNAAFCLAIVGLTGMQRRRFVRRSSSSLLQASSRAAQVHPRDGRSVSP